MCLLSAPRSKPPTLLALSLVLMRDNSQCFVNQEYEIAKFDVKAKEQNALRAGRAAPQRSVSSVIRPQRDVEDEGVTAIHPQILSLERS